MCCYCVNMCGWFLRFVANSTKDEDGDYNYKEMHDAYKLMKRIELWD